MGAVCPAFSSGPTCLPRSKYKIIEMAGPLRGTPKTGGRKAGTPNRRTVALQAATAAAEQINAALGPDTFDGDAHAFLMLVYRDPGQPAGLHVCARGGKVRLPYGDPCLGSYIELSCKRHPLQEQRLKFDGGIRLKANSRSLVAFDNIERSCIQNDQFRPVRLKSHQNAFVFNRQRFHHFDGKMILVGYRTKLAIDCVIPWLKCFFR
jgi:hypothetical protein